MQPIDALQTDTDLLQDVHTDLISELLLGPRFSNFAPHSPDLIVTSPNNSLDVSVFPLKEDIYCLLSLLH